MGSCVFLRLADKIETRLPRVAIYESAELHSPQNSEAQQIGEGKTTAQLRQRFVQTRKWRNH